MPKQPNVRPVYQSDAKYFRRLVVAVEQDLSRPVWWRARIIQRLNALIRDFDNVEEEAQEAQEEAATGFCEPEA